MIYEEFKPLILSACLPSDHHHNNNLECSLQRWTAVLCEMLKVCMG